MRNGFKFAEFSSSGQRLFGGEITLDGRGNAGNGRIDGYQGKQRFRLVKQTYHKYFANLYVQIISAMPENRPKDTRIADIRPSH